jgi:hypothetical protein
MTADEIIEYFSDANNINHAISELSPFPACLAIFSAAAVISRFVVNYLNQKHQNYCSVAKVGLFTASAVISSLLMLRGSPYIIAIAATFFLSSFERGGFELTINWIPWLLYVTIVTVLRVKLFSAILGYESRETKSEVKYTSAMTAKSFAVLVILVVFLRLFVQYLGNNR